MIVIRKNKDKATRASCKKISFDMKSISEKFSMMIWQMRLVMTMTYTTSI